MFKPLSCEKLQKSTLQQLDTKGYNYTGDVTSNNATWMKNLIADRKSLPFIIKSALDIYEESKSCDKIKTGCKSLDDCLNGGIHCGCVLEICGAPGQGKSQLCLQLCICVQLPKHLGGVDGEALYIDTSANFTAQRLKEIAICYGNTISKQYDNAWDPNTALTKVHYVKALGTAQFCAVMFMLEKIIEDIPKVKLIVIDNVATPFKDGCSDLTRIGILYRMMSHLNNIAYDKKIAIVITNELNMRLGLEEGQVGALGDTWAHMTHRVFLAPPLFTAAHQCAMSSIQISKEGISDCAA